MPLPCALSEQLVYIYPCYIHKHFHIKLHTCHISLWGKISLYFNPFQGLTPGEPNPPEFVHDAKKQFLVVLVHAVYLYCGYFLWNWKSKKISFCLRWIFYTSIFLHDIQINELNSHSKQTNRTAGKHTCAKMTSPILYLYSKMQDWWGQLKRAIICITVDFNKYQC